MRIYDIVTGRSKRIYANIIKGDQEITMGKIGVNANTFITGDNEGHLKCFSYDNGQFKSVDKSLSNEVSFLYVDKRNKLIVAAGTDSQILFQKETGKNTETIRQMYDAHMSSEIVLGDVSPYLNFLATVGHGGVIFVTKLYIYIYI